MIFSLEKGSLGKYIGRRKQIKNEKQRRMRARREEAGEKRKNGEGLE